MAIAHQREEWRPLPVYIVQVYSGQECASLGCVFQGFGLQESCPQGYGEKLWGRLAFPDPDSDLPTSGLLWPSQLRTSMPLLLRLPLVGDVCGPAGCFHLNVCGAHVAAVVYDHLPLEVPSVQVSDLLLKIIKGTQFSLKCYNYTTPFNWEGKHLHWKIIALDCIFVM